MPMFEVIRLELELTVPNTVLSDSCVENGFNYRFIGSPA
jgi:hypothetical protein